MYGSSSEGERKRIESAGGKVTGDRIDEMLNVSRAIGAKRETHRTSQSTALATLVYVKEKIRKSEMLS